MASLGSRSFSHVPIDLEQITSPSIKWGWLLFTVITKNTWNNGGQSFQKTGRLSQNITSGIWKSSFLWASCYYMCERQCSGMVKGMGSRIWLFECKSCFCQLTRWVTLGSFCNLFVLSWKCDYHHYILLRIIIVQIKWVNTWKVLRIAWAHAEYSVRVSSWYFYIFVSPLNEEFES